MNLNCISFLQWAYILHVFALQYNIMKNFIIVNY